MTTQVLHALAGPNGAGKSTLAGGVIVPRTHLPLVNADVIAAEQRAHLLAAERSFITESVFSQGSKVEMVVAQFERGRLSGDTYRPAWVPKVMPG